MVPLRDRLSSGGRESSRIVPTAAIDAQGQLGEQILEAGPRGEEHAGRGAVNLRRRYSSAPARSGFLALDSAMHSLVRLLLVAVVSVVAVWWSSCGVVRAQDMRGDIYTPFRPGPYIPYDGAPFSHRYNYPSPPYLFLT